MKKIKVRLEHVRQLTGREQLELAFMLGYLANRHSLEQPTRFIDVVNAQDFGNATRVNNYLQRLSTLDQIDRIKKVEKIIITTPPRRVAIAANGIKFKRFAAVRIAMSPVPPKPLWVAQTTAHSTG